MLRRERRFRIAVLVCGALLASGCTAPRVAKRPEVPGSSVELDVRVVGATEPRLSMRLTNRSARELVIRKALLPWREGGRMSLRAVVCDARGSRLEKRYSFPDRTAEEALIQPGENLSEALSLADLFVGFREALAHADVVVFWTYRLEPENQPPLQLSGSVTIPHPE